MKDHPLIAIVVVVSGVGASLAQIADSRSASTLMAGILGGEDGEAQSSQATQSPQATVIRPASIGGTVPATVSIAFTGSGNAATLASSIDDQVRRLLEVKVARSELDSIAIDIAELSFSGAARSVRVSWSLRGSQRSDCERVVVSFVGNGELARSIADKVGQSANALQQGKEVPCA